MRIPNQGSRPTSGSRGDVARLPGNSTAGPTAPALRPTEGVTEVRILHVNKFLHRRGGTEAYADDLAQLQHVAGHDVTFFGMHHPDNETYQYERSFPAEISFTPPPRSPVGKLKNLGRMMWSTSAARGFDEVLDDFKPDIVHLHNIYHQLSPSILRPLAYRGIPAVMTVHDYKLACPTSQLLDHGKPCTACVTGGPMQALRKRCNGSLTRSAAAALETTLHRKVNAYAPIHRFLCPSWFLADVMRSAGVYPDRLHLQDNFIDTEVVFPSHVPGEGAVFVGRLSQEKGVDVLIRAWEHLPAKAHLHIAGDGPQRNELERLAEQLVPGRVTFHGNLDSTKTHDLMRSAAVVVVPSVWHENQPLAVLEAFACARPVVATRMGGLPELVDPGVDGELVAPRDSATLADAIRPFVLDPARAAAMGQAARTKVERRFAPAVHAAAIEEHYQAVLADQHGHAADAGDTQPADGDNWFPWPADDEDRAANAR
ncbi:MAG: glycosyltransferase [Streptosporangiales bacterium]|nr:glycosyltransferase [Streptosporangiales bacterium]